MSRLLNELYKTFNSGSAKKKYAYFLWKNKMRNKDYDYGRMTEEEFKTKYCNGSDRSFQILKIWEGSEQYNYFVNLMLFEKMGNDFKQIYDITADKAKKGDDKAVKTFLLLKDEVDKYVKQNRKKTKQNEQEENDGLTLE